MRAASVAPINAAVKYFPDHCGDTNRPNKSENNNAAAIALNTIDRGEVTIRLIISRHIIKRSIAG